MLIALCSCGTGGGENEQYLNLFDQFWSKGQQGQLFNLDVVSVDKSQDGWKQVTISYTHGIGENYPSRENQAAMLVSPDGKTMKKCVYDLSTGSCLGGGQPDWTYQP